MKKLFVSVPMKNRKPEDIKATIDFMHSLAETIFGEELEVIDTMHVILTDDIPENKRGLYCLGHSISLMAEADYYIGMAYSNVFNGCVVENMTADQYMDAKCTYILPITLLERHFPDISEIERNWYNRIAVCADEKD